jgi:hypothetical protein
VVSVGFFAVLPMIRMALVASQRIASSDYATDLVRL